jgi:hypothetical protein
VTVRARRNSRRTWPDGSGCDHRPLHPHAPGCPGWLSFRKGKDLYVIVRCPKCKTFDDDADAAAHVSRCKTCRGEMVEHADAAEAENEAAQGHDLPSFAERRELCAWANARARNRYDDDNDTDDYGPPPGRLRASESDGYDIGEWLAWYLPERLTSYDDADAWDALRKALHDYYK